MLLVQENIINHKIANYRSWNPLKEDSKTQLLKSVNSMFWGVLETCGFWFRLWFAGCLHSMMCVLHSCSNSKNFVVVWCSNIARAVCCFSCDLGRISFILLETHALSSNTNTTLQILSYHWFLGILGGIMFACWKNPSSMLRPVRFGSRLCGLAAHKACGARPGQRVIINGWARHGRSLIRGPKPPHIMGLSHQHNETSTSLYE